MSENENSLWVIRHADVQTHQEKDADFDAIKSRLQNLKPDIASKAGNAYQSAANELADKAKLLTEKHAPALIAAWGGPAAQKALDQMALIHKTNNGLSDQSIQAAQSFKWYGEKILPWYKDAGHTMSDGYIHTGGDDDNARDLMNRLNGRAADVQKNFPEHATTDLPNQKEASPYLGDPNGPGGPKGSPLGGGGGKMPGGGMPDGKVPGNDPFGNPSNNKNPYLPTGDHSNFPNGSHLPGGDGSKFPGGNGSNFPGGSGTHLAGYDPAGLPGGGGLPGSGGTGLSGGGTGLGGDPFGGAGGGLGTGSGMGTMGAGGVGAGGLGTGAGANGAAAAGRMAGGGGMMPPMHPGHGQGEKERERSTWLQEDEDIWGGDGDAVPGQIG
ncbi:hypothetical protein GCM10023196_107220 [Actinoallomurus vinaceus]|uniref:Uncharacterized protein n=1 Tax=Actinoallomurus vinaceus TaxID=1080074 RepID=A0ABP8UUS5_9ACTN